MYYLYLYLYFVCLGLINQCLSISVAMPSRPSYAQLEGLVEFLEQNPGVAKGLVRTTQGQIETKRKWENLATSLNSLGGANKNGRAWAKYWAEKKCALRKHCAGLSASMRRTGGGASDNLPALSALDTRLVAVMGGREFATGDTSLAVNPFPQSTSHSSHTELPIMIEIVETGEQVMQANNNSPILGMSHIDAIPASSTIPASPTPLENSIPTIPPAPRTRRRRRSSISRPLDSQMEQFSSIEARRVEAELITAQALAKLSENIGNIANALTSIANAISDVASKMPNP
ncbi:unnamed protein product [Spodoptera littoralis]|uniref:Regulatory protein zeste n=1 Tax=Spodoptera littoralis TaxID=7109 RepID=A0A9P0ID15_SPOLI|nr:unnamed protein product [Spodoptera littoralis]CAB3512738.1 unnamed protein product [Spodoptera littoralis]CAH1636338.1 unnamed protein product [Spodoptera littoralis]CAH1642975.1 unnamed protein product [Spodoptera littoralis]